MQQQQIYIVDNGLLLEKTKRLQDGDELVEMQSSCFGINASHVPPPKGFRHPVNFPLCCEYHRDQFARTSRLYDQFPGCCAGHSRLVKAPWFHKLNYVYMPFKIVSLVAYLYDKINEYHIHPNWRKEITDYIDYCIRSFGQFPDGYGAPLGLSLYLADCYSMVEAHPLLREDQKTTLLLRLHPEPTEIKEPTDLTSLQKTYKDWMQLFPFDLAIFRHLKPIFERHRPFLKGPGNTNRYTGLTCFQIRTRAELKELLVGMTQLLLKEINSAKLFKEGKLLEADKLHFEMIMEQRRIRLEEEVLAPVSDQADFIRLLDHWLGHEKEFLKDIQEFVYRSNPMQFIHDLIGGIHQLQQNGINEPCVKNIRENGANKETLVRYWFRNWFKARYPHAEVTPEEERGDKYMDLKVARRGAPDRIVEFKGWWNADKIQVPQQLCNYLTDFEKEGYVFLINDCQQKRVVEDYKAIVTAAAMHYVADSWTIHRYDHTDFYYYQSSHQFEGEIKTIYHFIFNAFF